MDTVSRETRSRIMASIRSVSRMEIAAGGLARRKAGCALRHHPAGLVGKPDYANKSRRVAVFVNGCFWHGCPRHFRMPKSNMWFWREKIDRNKKRDTRILARYRYGGWQVIVIWEHELKAKASGRCRTL